jgi:hypothetical protein
MNSGELPVGAFAIEAAAFFAAIRLFGIVFKWVGNHFIAMFHGFDRAMNPES